MAALTYTATDIVTLIRATNGSEFSLSGGEAELLVKLFASAAASDESVKVAQQVSDRILSSLHRGRAA